MRPLPLIVPILLIVLNFCAQQNKQYYFPEIGMSIQLPTRYIIQDTFPRPSFLDSNLSPITNSETITQMQEDIMKGLLLVNYPDERNSMSLNIVIETSKTGNFEQYYQFSKSMQELLANQQMKTYDTLSKIYNVDNILVHKFLTNSEQRMPNQYSGFYLAKVKKHYLFVKFDYTDKSIGEEFEKTLLSATFK